MTLNKKLGALGAAAVLSLSLTACGGGGADAAGAPKNADPKAFCDFLTKHEQMVNDSASPADQVEQAHKYAEDLAKIGTPKTVTGDDRQGFEALIEWLNGLDEADAKRFDKMSGGDAKDLFGDKADVIQGFLTNSMMGCAKGQMPDLGDLASDMATAIPSN
ncbi:hypothetical protein [Nocardioides montaniterrae]